MLVDVVPVHVGSALQWIRDAGTSWQVPEVIFRADSWLANAAAFVWGTRDNVPNVTMWASPWHAHAVFVLKAPGKVRFALLWEVVATAKSGVPELSLWA